MRIWRDDAQISPSSHASLESQLSDELVNYVTEFFSPNFGNKRRYSLKYFPAGG